MGMVSTMIFFRTNNKFVFIYYIAYCAVIPFQFFRDAFYIVNKNIFFTFLVFPASALFINGMFYKSVKQRKEIEN
jgi:hypothetical protein